MGCGNRNCTDFEGVKTELAYIRAAGGSLNNEDNNFDAIVAVNEDGMNFWRSMMEVWVFEAFGRRWLVRAPT